MMKKKMALAFAAVIAAGFTMAGCSNTQAAPPAPSVSQTQAVAPVETTTVSTSAASVPSVTAGTQKAAAITEEQAKQIALDHAGVKEADVQFIRVKLDMDDGVQEYDVNFYIQGKEYDYDIATDTGDIRSYDYEVEDDAWMMNNGDKNASPVTVEEAKKKALERVPGATDSNIVIKTDIDDGRTVYEGKIIYNNTEFEFEIDANTGTFLEWDSESAFD